MAQNFRRYTLNNVGTTVASIPNASTFDSYDTIVGISIANIASNQALVDVYINDGTNDIYLAKEVPLPAGSALQLLDGGAKIVVKSGDRLWVKSSLAAKPGCMGISSRRH